MESNLNYKQWHDKETGAFHARTNVYFSQCDKNKLLSLNELLRITSDLAVEDYRQQGMSREVLLQNGYAILVSRCSFRIHSMPRENDRIEIVTREERPEPLQLMRAYEILDENGTSLVSGSSSWLVVDLSTRRILPTKKFTMRNPTEFTGEHDCLPVSKIIVPENIEQIDERTIRRSDIDANGHTNNSRYGAFISDALGDILDKTQISDFRINYSKEAMLGEKLNIYSSYDEASKKILLVGKTDSATSFESEIFLK